MGMYEHAGDVAADNEAVMYHRILMSATNDDEYLAGKDEYKDLKIDHYPNHGVFS